LADARCTRRGGSSWWQVRASYSCGRRSAGAICGSTVAGNASGFHVLRRVGFEIEDELLSAGAELNAVAGDNPCGSDDPLFVNEGAVSAVQVGDHKLVRVGRVLRDLRVLASHKIVSFGIVFYGHRGVSADQKFPEVREGEFFDLVGLRTADMPQNNALHLNHPW